MRLLKTYVNKIPTHLIYQDLCRVGACFWCLFDPTASWLGCCFANVKRSFRS